MAAFALIAAFANDFHQFSFVKLNSVIIASAENLIVKYSSEGLRTLDAIQLASIFELKQQIELAITADKVLNSIIGAEGIATDF